MTALGLVSIAILSASVCGCGKNTAAISGKISYKGRAVTYGSVTFVSADKTARSGVISPDGAYSIDEVPPGNAVIAVISRNPALGRTIVKRDKSAQGGQKETTDRESSEKNWFPLPTKYESVKTSGLECTVPPRSYKLDIDLK